MPLNLTYSTYSASLPSPQLGDIKRFSSQAVTRKLKSPIPKIFKDASWPVIEIYQYSIRGLTLAQKTAFENLYNASVGLSVTLEETYGVTLTGYIMSNTVEILTIKDSCNYDLEFEFLATVVSYQVGDGYTDPNYETVTPVPGDSGFFSTLENDRNYQLYNEADTVRLQAEDGSYLYVETF